MVHVNLLTINDNLEESIMTNIQKVTIKELENISKGSASSPRVTPTTTVVPASLAVCPTTKCASVVKACPGK